MADERHFKWDNTNKKWTVSLNGGAFTDVVENPTHEHIKLNAGSDPGTTAAIYYDSGTGRVFVKPSITIPSVADSGGNLRFSASNPYIYASSYIVMPGGLYISGTGVLYVQGTIYARGGAPSITTDEDEDLVIANRSGYKTQVKGLIEQHGGVVYNPNGIINTVKAIVWYAPYACTITEARFIREDGSSSFTVDFVKNGSTYICSSRVTLTSSGTWYTGTLSTTTLAAGDNIALEITTIAGSPTKVGFFLTVRRDG